MSNYVITIARSLGSGGSHIAKALSKELQIPVYDTEILEMASEASGINESFFYEANEKISKGQLTIKNSTGVYKGTHYAPSDPKYLSNENLFSYQAEVIKEIAITGKQSCIIIGKAANKIIGSLKNVVTVSVQADLDRCVRNTARRLQTNEVDARKKVLQTNKYRADYYKYYTGGDWSSPTEYDLSINTGAVSEEYAVKMILDLLRYRGILS